MKNLAITAAFLSLVSTISSMPVSNNKVIIPETISIYHGFNGKLEFNVPSGKISRVQGGNDDISTLMTFSFPESSRGLTCEFMFELDDSTYTLNPVNPSIDVFRSSQIATASSPGWGPPSNYRDVQLGRLKVKAGGEAEKSWGSFTFPCPAGEKKGFEVTPTGDVSGITWNEPTDGPWIQYY
ncbi:hypothetical protein BS50DRAFT_401434 [Corynespora cassiicola Philippines]|uniref:Ubiquitin 3 binding protein But2 C-terminal domain-containing protein n=1 Tax=Corynespora cassiicola Philippines TaxID=1448308 RepID=A0A2T2NKY1_CORCC|nr:hypothetical protein BS50DRAFT_401434 [Corynespora cassiicola Philippines]